VGTDVRILRVRYTHTLRRKLSRREISVTGRVWVTPPVRWVCVAKALQVSCVSLAYGLPCLWAHCILAFLTGVCHITLCTSFSDWARNGLMIGWRSSPNNTPPPWTWFQPGPRLSCLADGPTQCNFGRAGRVGAPPAAFNRRPFSQCLLAIHTAPVCGCVVSSTAAALRLLLCGTALL